MHTYTKPQTSSMRSRCLGWRIHGSVEDTKLSTNKQHTLSPGLRTRITGQVRVRVMQAGQTRSCGARTHTHKHPHTEMPAVGSHATCAAEVPYPPAPPPPRPFFVTCDLSFQRSFGQLKIVNRPTPGHKLRPCFQVPTDSQGLWGPHEQYLSDPWAPGHAVLCVWKPE